MSRARLAALAVAAAVLAPSVARGQSSSSVFFYGVGAAQPVSEQTVPVRISGRIIVQFTGQASAGCAAHGLCGDSGTVSWTPAPAADLEIQGLRVGGRTRYAFVLLPQVAGPGMGGGVTSADVTLAGAGTPSTCVDTTSQFGSFGPTVHGGEVTFGVAQSPSSLLSTRCAGPRAAAVSPFLPAQELSVSALRRGRRTVALAASRSFSADGFSGTVVSSIEIRLGRPGKISRPQAATAEPPRRALRLSLRADVAGSLTEQVSADPALGACEPLGACGTTGTVTVTPRASSFGAQLEAIAPAGRPAPDLETAAGLGPEGTHTGIDLAGGAEWASGGTVVATIDQGSSQCLDTTRLGEGVLTLVSDHGRLDAVFSGNDGAAGVPQTGCPGPLGGEDAGGLAAGSVPLARLAQRRFTIPLSSGSSFQDYGYDVRTVSHLAITLTRVGSRSVTVGDL